MKNRIQNLCLVIVLGASFVGVAHGASKKRKLEKLQGEFQSATVVSDDIFSEHPNWECDYRPVHYDDDTTSAKYELLWSSNHNGDYIHMTHENASFPSGYFMFKKDEEIGEWRFKNTFLRMLDEETIIIEKNAKTVHLERLYMEVVCGNFDEDECFISKSEILDNRFVIGYRKCTRMD